MKINRRNFCQTMGAGAAGFGLVSTLPLSSCANSSEKSEEDGQVLFIGDDIAIADTVYGKVQGFMLNDVYHFRGIPYGADTGGKNRFMPPQKPEPWSNVFPAVWWGNSAPQILDNQFSRPYSSFADCWNYDAVSEDCLRLNVWTKGLADEGKRPVIMWLHGGGFSAGNGIEQDGYKGENLSKKGDIVFVSINHRLGSIGFSDLSGVGGNKYADSGNVGALDMIAALEWVKENIANFGGDPGNVTIIGQSGGGAKVCTVAAMPKSKGLIHKAVPLSGSTTQSMDQSVSQKLGEYILKEAGLKPSEIDKLQEIPWREYIQLASRASQKYTQENGQFGARGGYGPVADGVNIPKGVFFSDESGVSSDVPMMICSTFHERSIGRLEPELENISVEGAKEYLKTGSGRGGFGDKAPEIYEAYAKAFPESKPIEILNLVSASRRGVVDTATAKSKQKAPVYVAWFGWEPPLFSNRMRAFHCIDICFWFYNTDLMITHTGGGARPRKLSEKMSNALLEFMRTGNPNGGGLPEWPDFTVENGETMILDDLCEVKNDPDREARKLLL
jgi:para-nitrobenzyl esterase